MCTVISGDLKLTGYFVSPVTAKKVPAVLFLHGGGRYETNLYDEWQSYLGDHGIASLIVYSRGVHTSEGNFEDGSLENRLADAEAAYKLLPSEPTVDPSRVCIYGSSMGGHVAVRLSQNVPSTMLVLQSAAAYAKEAESLPLNKQFTDALSIPNSWESSPVFDELQTYNGFVYVIYGKNDTVIPTDVQQRFELSIRNGKFERLSCGTHLLLRQKDEEGILARKELFEKVTNELLPHFEMNR
jgi:dienelactone hydrolase